MQTKTVTKKTIKAYVMLSIKALMVFFLLIQSFQYILLAALTEITPITTPTHDSTPDYSFSSDLEIGAITYSGSCTSGSLTTIGAIGTYTTTLDTLADGTYNDCELIIGGVTLAISPFTIDTTYPTITITNPDTTPALTKNITASTNEGTLLYAVNPIGDTTCDGTLIFGAYMPETFSSEADNGKYICYRAIDTAGNSSFALSDAIGGIDTTSPTATVEYAPASGSRTNTDVIAIITGFNETATGLNTTGFTFTGNGTFTFTFEDLLGNTGELIATVDRIDKSAPTWTINAGVNGGTVQTETINVTATDVNLDAGSLLYGFSADGICDITDTYTTPFTNSTDFIITGDNRQYLCLKGADNLGATSYKLVGQLETDNTNPTYSGIIDGAYYNIDVTINHRDDFNMRGATVDGALFAPPKTFTGEGYHTLVVTDVAGNNVTAYFTIDKTQPVITNITTGQYINTGITPAITEINYSGATLNGSDYTSGTAITSDGIYELIITDLAGNSTGITFTIDKTDPTFAGVVSGIYYNTNQNITFDDTNLSGATLNGIAYTSGDTISAEGIYVFIVYDLAGNSTGATFTIDKTDPTFAGVVSGIYYNTNQNITFDDTNLSGATLNGTTYISGNSISADNSYIFIVYDLAGNSTGATFILDKTGPIIGTGIILAGNTGVNGSTGYYNGTITIGATISDALAGISGATCEYSTGITRASATYSGGAGYCSISGLSPAADINVNFRIQDIAGNLNTGGIGTYIYDITAPTTTDNANSTTGRVDVTVTLSPIDTGVGLSGTLYCVDTTNTCTPNILGTSVSVTGATGVITHKYVRYYSVDTLNNSETTHASAQINIDKELPVLTGTTTFSSNNITNTGYAKVNDTITVFFQSHETLSSLPIMTIAGGTSTGIVTNIGGNNYSGTYVMKSTDVQGTIGFNIFMTDLVGNTGTTFTGSTIIFDRTAPAGIAFTSPLATSYRQNQSGTDYRTITWNTGTESNFGPTSLQIQFSTNGFGGISIISTGTNNDGTFDRTVNSIDTSTAQIRIIATDLAGNRTTITSAAFIIDSTPPVAPTITYPTGGEYFKGGNTYIITRTGGYDDNLSGTILELSTDGGITKNILTSLIGSPNLYARTPATTINSNSVRLGIYLQDKGLLASSHSWILNNFTVDSIKPTLTFADTSSGRRSTNATGTVTTIDTGAGVASTGIVYKTSSAFTDTCDGGTTTPPTFTTDGYRTGYACVMDRAGNIRTGQQSYKIDKTAPLLNMGSAIITNTGTTINITTTGDIAGIASYARSKISGSGTITFSSATIEDPFVTASDDDMYVLQIVITDNAGNATTGTINFTRNATAPIITTGTVTNLTSRTPTFTFTATNSGTLYRSGTCTSSTTTAVSGSNSLTLSTLANATYSSCYVRIKDSMNNSGARFNLPTFTVNYTAPSGGGGGGGGGGISVCTSSLLTCTDGKRELKAGASCYGGGLGESCGTDVCVDGDYSGNPSDGICYDATKIEVNSGNTNTGTLVPYISPYNKELTDAYTYAYKVKITTVPDIKRANLTGILIRSHLSKMMSEYMTKVLGKSPDTSRNCVFKDMNGQTEEFKNYAILSCQLGLMGLKTDGTPAEVFNPNDEVTRAIFGTTLSRALFGETYNGGQNRYEKHLQALKTNAIMTQIDKPFNREIRGYVMLMMMRADQKLTKSIYSNFTSIRGTNIFVPTTNTTVITNTTYTAEELDFIAKTNKTFQFTEGYILGESSNEIKYLQYLLKDQKYYTGTINGINNVATVAALFKFQFDNNIVKNETDQGAGYLGPTTREIINPLLQTLLNP